MTTVSSDASERVARFLGGVDGGDNFGVRLGIQRVNGASVADGQVEGKRRGLDPAQAADVAEDLDSEGLQEQLREGADGDPERSFAGTGAFENLADAGLVVDRSGEVDMAASGRGGFSKSFEFGVVVDQSEGNGGPGRLSVIGAGLDVDDIRLKLLSFAPAVAALPALRARSR